MNLFKFTLLFLSLCVVSYCSLEDLSVCGNGVISQATGSTCQKDHECDSMVCRNTCTQENRNFNHLAKCVSGSCVCCCVAPTVRLAPKKALWQFFPYPKPTPTPKSPTPTPVTVTTPLPSGASYAWGTDMTGQVGNGYTADSYSTPQKSSLGVALQQVSSLGGHTLFLGVDGKVYASGSNTYSQLGVSSTLQNSLTPVLVQLTEAVTQVAAGSLHSLVLTASGNVYSWGNNDYGQLGSSTSPAIIKQVTIPNVNKFVSVAAGLYTSFFVTDTGDVYSCGRNDVGQLGFPVSSTIKTPTKITFPSTSVLIANVSSFSDHALARTVTGQVYSWGLNFNGQLGLNYISGQPVTTPTLVSGVIADQIAAGDGHSLARAGGTVYGWGDNENFQISSDSATKMIKPTQNMLFSQAQSVAAGGFHSIVLQGDGSMTTFGANDAGELGRGYSGYALDYYGTVIRSSSDNSPQLAKFVAGAIQRTHAISP